MQRGSHCCSIYLEACSTYIFPPILYRLSIPPLYKDHKKALSPLSCRVMESTKFAEMSALHLCHVWQGLPYSKFAFVCRVFSEHSIFEGSVRDACPSLVITPPVSRADSRFKPPNQWRFTRECRATLRAILRSSKLSRSRRLLY